MTNQHGTPNFATELPQPFADKCDCGNDATQVHEDGVGRLLYFCEDCDQDGDAAESDAEGSE